MTFEIFDVTTMRNLRSYYSASIVNFLKQSSIHIVVPPIWFESNFEKNIDKVDEALNALWELYSLSLRLAVK